nr:glycosyltransferase family 4 protein [Azospirillum sp. OGB3]
MDDTPAGRAAVSLAHALQRRGYGLDVVAPMGGGPLRAALHPGIGQIDLAKRHTNTSVLALARILAERRPSGLVGVGNDAGLVALAAVRLARQGTPTAVLEDTQRSDSRLQRALGRWLHPRASMVSPLFMDPGEAAPLILAAFGLRDRLR